MMLDRPLEWQKVTLTPDSAGQREETWITHKTVWGHLMPLRGSESYESNQKVAISNYRYVVRWDEDFVPFDRIKDGTLILEIESVNEFQPAKSDEPNTREHYLLLYCSSRDSSNTGRDG